MRKEICTFCNGKGEEKEHHMGGTMIGQTWHWKCPYCKTTGIIQYKWWEWLLLLLFRKMQEIDDRQSKS